MMSSQSLWAVRVFVLGAFAATVWFCGPRAAAVLAAKFGSEAQPGPMVSLDRVGFAERPDWLGDEMLVTVAESLAPWLGDEVAILDDEASRRVRDTLLQTPWVRSARIVRVFPDQFRIHLRLRQPLLAVYSADSEPLCLVDEQCVMLPWVKSSCPKVVLYREGGRPTMDVVVGEVCDESRVRVATGIATEWREQLVPLVDDCPELLEVDTTNLGERWIRGPQYPEVRVHVARNDGQQVVFAYGRPVDSPLRRVSVESKAIVLKKILKQHQGLSELVAGDLRFARRWADYLHPRAPGVPNPIGPWQELVTPGGR